ncbi:MAG: macro domain-containing protein [Candidatus Nanopelagicales bacterium]
MRLRVRHGTLQAEATDAVARSARPRLVDSSQLMRAAGPVVAEACEDLIRHEPRYHHGVPAGEAVVTGAGALPARLLIHVVTPDFSVRQDRTHLLAQAYRSCLAVADDYGVRRLSLTPLGSTYPYWPLPEVIRIALTTLENTPTGVDVATLVVPTPQALEVFAEALARR